MNSNLSKHGSNRAGGCGVHSGRPCRAVTAHGEILDSLQPACVSRMHVWRLLVDWARVLGGGFGHSSLAGIRLRALFLPGLNFFLPGTFFALPTFLFADCQQLQCVLWQQDYCVLKASRCFCLQ